MGRPDIAIVMPDLQTCASVTFTTSWDTVVADGYRHWMLVIVAKNWPAAGMPDGALSALHARLEHWYPGCLHRSCHSVKSHCDWLGFTQWRQLPNRSRGMWVNSNMPHISLLPTVSGNYEFCQVVCLHERKINVNTLV